MNTTTHFMRFPPTTDQCTENIKGFLKILAFKIEEVFESATSYSRALMIIAKITFFFIFSTLMHFASTQGGLLWMCLWL